MRTEKMIQRGEEEEMITKSANNDEDVVKRHSRERRDIFDEFVTQFVAPMFRWMKNLPGRMKSYARNKWNGTRESCRFYSAKLLSMIFPVDGENVNNGNGK